MVLVDCSIEELHYQYQLLTIYQSQLEAGGHGGTGGKTWNSLHICRCQGNGGSSTI